MLNSGSLSGNVKAFVDRFDSKIGFIISEDLLILAEAASFGSLPAYIVFSRQFLEHFSGEDSYFEENDLISLAAHELGHIIPKSHFQLFVVILISAFMLVIFMALYFRTIALSLLFIPLLMCLGYVSRREEYRADSFAVKEAGISIQQFTKSLVKGSEFLNTRRISPGNYSNDLMGRFIKLFFVSHPSIEQRIFRLQSLYGRSAK